jgi:SsrA-binding protein
LRERELLLNKKELYHINNELKVKGITLIPLQLFINKGGKAKLKIGLGRGKKNHDKRESIKSRDIDKQTKRELTN